MASFILSLRDMVSGSKMLLSTALKGSEPSTSAGTASELGNSDPLIILHSSDQLSQRATRLAAPNGSKVAV